MGRRQLRTTRTVIIALGGTAKVARVTGATYAAAYNWLSKGRFPAWTYLAITAALDKQELTASPELWPQMARRNECA